MKFLKKKYIIPSLLIIVLAVFLGLFFIGSLTASADVKYDNEKFDKDGFMDASTEGFVLDTAYKVYDNGTYTMFFDESTTIVKIVVNSSCDAPDSPSLSTCKTVYEVADDKSDVSTEKSTFLIRYFLENGTINSSDLSSWANSVQYENRITGETERHYSFRYLEDGVDVLYNIGNFTNVSSYFPTQFDRATFDELFRGNMVLYTPTDTQLLKEAKGDIIMRYTGQGATYSAECAAYLEENGLATVTPGVDTEGNSLGYWTLTDLLDTEGRIKLKLGVDYNTTALEGEEGYSPCTSNPFTNSTVINYIYSNTVYELESTINGDTENRLNIFHNQYTENSSQIFKFKASNSTIIIKNLLKYMYEINTYDENGVQLKENFYTIRDSSTREDRVVMYDYKGDGELKPYKLGGFQAKDEEGRYLYDENGDPVQAGFTAELAQEQNELFGHDEEAKATSFQVGIRFRLTDEGFKVTVLNESIVEESASKIYQIELLPYFTVNNDKTSKGQIVVPDGSGAIISFNSVKDVQNADAYIKQIHGDDVTIPKEERGNVSEKILLGMYGFLDFTEKRGVVAIVDKGASLSWIQADFLRASQTTSYNFARFISDLRTYEVVSLSSGSSFNKWTNEMYKGDIVYEYRFLGEDELSYVDVAHTYREYLLEKYADEGLEAYGDTTTSHVPTVRFLGAFEKKKLTLGVVHNKDYALTTFDQAIEILEELNENGVEDFNVAFDAWTDEAMEASLTKNVKPSKVLGGKEGLSRLDKYLAEKGYDFYLLANLATGKGYDYNFGEMKYSPKTVTSDYSTMASFVLSTGLSDSSRKPMAFISPRFYEAYLNNYLKKFDKYATKGIALDDVANMRIGDYSKKGLTYTETSAMYQSMILDRIVTEEGRKVMLSSPFEYALPYTSVATDIPLTATLLPSIDYSIPLYQLVVSGMFDYSGVPANFENDNLPEWYFLKALETGSNLSFILSAEDTKVLLETNYTENYGAYYLNWKHKIISLNNQLNEVGIYNSRLVSHEFVTDNVVKVEYENGLKLMINFDDDTYQDKASGLAIASNWYIVLEEGR